MRCSFSPTFIEHFTYFDKSFLLLSASLGFPKHVWLWKIIYGQTWIIKGWEKHIIKRSFLEMEYRLKIHCWNSSSSFWNDLHIPSVCFEENDFILRICWLIWRRVKFLLPKLGHTIKHKTLTLVIVELTIKQRVRVLFNSTFDESN